MALTRAMAASGEQSTNTELTVTHAIALSAGELGANKLMLPVIDAGAGQTVAAGFIQTIYNNSATVSLEVRDALGFKVGLLGPQQTAQVKATGDVTASRWIWESPIEETMQLKAADFVAVGAGAALAFTANTNAAILTPGTVNTYMKVRLVDGTVGYIPVYK